MNDIAAIKTLLTAYESALSTADMESFSGLLSDDFQDSKGTSKAELIKHYSGATGLAIDFFGGELTVDGNVATFSRATISSPKGSLTNVLTIRQESDGIWRICRTEAIDWDTEPMDEEQRIRRYESDQLAMTIRTFREKLLSDPARPGYHFVMPEGIATPFDPNGAIYWKGRYHLFYIFQDRRSGKKQDHWGHVSSTDLFHWRHHPSGLLDGMYSGNCFLNKDGVPTICYHQVKQGNAIAVALDDELNTWQKLPSNPITPATSEGDEYHGRYRSWDPYGWFDGDTYYAIFGGKTPGIAKASDLEGEWQYVGDLFAHGVNGVPLDEDVSCADFFRLGNKDVLLCISHTMGCRYYIGEWRDEQFYPESHAQMSWTDNLFFAPESLLDDKGRRIMWAWLMDYREFGVRFDQGWSGTMSLPRILSLDDSGNMLIDLPEEIEALRYDEFSKQDFTIASDEDLLIGDVSGNSLELFVEMESASALEFGVKVCVSPDAEEETVVSYNPVDGQLVIDTTKSGPEDRANGIEAGPFRLRDNERLQMRVFIDKSVIEVFANRRQAVVRRIYPVQPESIGVRLFSKTGSARVHKLSAWKISPSNPY